MHEDDVKRRRKEDGDQPAGASGIGTGEGEGGSPTSTLHGFSEPESHGKQEDLMCLAMRHVGLQHENVTHGADSQQTDRGKRNSLLTSRLDLHSTATCSSHFGSLHCRWIDDSITLPIRGFYHFQV